MEFNKKIISICQLFKNCYEVTLDKTCCNFKMPKEDIITIVNIMDKPYYIYGKKFPYKSTTEISTQNVKHKTTLDIIKAHKNLGA